MRSILHRCLFVAKCPKAHTITQSNVVLQKKKNVFTRDRAENMNAYRAYVRAQRPQNKNNKKSHVQPEQASTVEIQIINKYFQYECKPWFRTAAAIHYSLPVCTVCASFVDFPSLISVFRFVSFRFVLDHIWFWAKTSRVPQVQLVLPPDQSL